MSEAFILLIDIRGIKKTSGKIIIEATKQIF